MTSGNAFRDNAHLLVVATEHASPNGDAGHARKRRRLSPPPQANIFTRTGDVSAALEVDHMILDYLSHEATTAVLASRTSKNMASSGFENKLAMVDAFLEMFKARHPSYEPDAELRFRLLLSKFATLFCHRIVRGAVMPSKSALRCLRDSNTLRAMEWIQSADRMPSSKHDVSGFETGSSSDRSNKEANGSQRHDDMQTQLEGAQHKATTKDKQQAYCILRRAYTLKALGFPAENEAYEDAFYGTPESVSLLDILPSFMAVIAARNELNNSNLSTGLMELAAQFMLQASLEQYLVRGATGCDAIDEAFAWGYKPPHPTNGQKNSTPTGLNGDGPTEPIVETDRMFQSEDNVSQEIPDWSEIKASYIAELAHSESGSLKRHLEEVADGYPIEDFEETILQLLQGLAASLPIPVLAQLEKGSLDGMSSAETKAFLSDCGLDGHWPLVLNEL